MSKIARALSFTLLALPLLTGHMLAQEWTKFSSAEGKFSILTPAKAQAGNFDVQVGSIKVTAHVFTALSHPVFVMCGYYDFPSAPSDPEKVFDETREGSVRDVHGTLLTEKKLAKDGYPGRRFRLTAKNAFLDEEMFLVGHRFYFIKISTSTPTPSTNITRVFDSFHFAVSQ